MATATVALLVLSACGGDDEAGGSGASAGPDLDALLGAEKPATGTPVKVGFISDGKGDAVDNTAEIDAARAATEYVNKHLGGVNGHPIELSVCETGQTPSGTTDCATKLVDEKVSVVMNGVSGRASIAFKGLEGSGIPFFTFANVETPIVSSPAAFVLSNGLATIAGPAGVAKEKGLTKAALLVIDVPAASGPANQVGVPFYANAGVTLEVVAVPQGTADLAPQVQAALNNGTEQFAIIGDPNFCTAALKSIKTLSPESSVVVIQQCIDPGGSGSIPGGYEGMSLITNSTDDTDDADYKVFDAAMKKFTPGQSSRGGVAPGGYITIVAFARALEGVTGELTPAAIATALGAMPAPVDLPLGGGITFQCGKKAIAITPAICSTQSLVAQLDKDGKGTDYKTQDTSELTKLG